MTKKRKGVRGVGAIVVATALALWGVGTWAQGEPAGLILSEAVHTALAGHPDIREAELAVRTATLQMESAVTSLWLPRIGVQISPGGASSQRAFPGTAEGTISLGLTFITGTVLSFSLSPTLDWSSMSLSYSWGLSLLHRYDPAQPTPSVLRDLSSRQEALRTAEEALARAQAGVVLTTIEGFAHVLAAQQKVAQARAGLARAEDRLREVEREVTAGRASELQRLDAEISWRDAQIKVRKSELELATAKDRLAWLSGSDAVRPFVVPEFPLDAILGAVRDLLSQGIPEEAVAGSSRVQSAEAAVRTAEDALRTAQAGGWPTPSISFRLTGSGWQVGMGVEFDLFNPGRAVAVELARVNVEVARVRLASARVEAERMISQQRTALEVDRENLDLLSLESEKLIVETRATELKLDAGVIGWADWEDFQARKDAFRGRWTLAVFDLVLAYLRLRDALLLDLDWEGFVR